VRELTEALGSTPAAVAGSLADLRIRATPKSLTDCALARYLNPVVTSEPFVVKRSVTNRSIHLARSRGHLPIVVQLPAPLANFIRAFDAGCYPELIETSSEFPAGQPS
jgi:hypothetical protein